MREVDLGLHGVVHVVGEGVHYDVADDLYDLLVGPAGVLGFLESLVGRLAPVLNHLFGEVQGGGPLGVLGIETLCPGTLVGVEPDLLRDRGVQRESVVTAVVV